jgi:hypothetical protein
MDKKQSRLRGYEWGLDRPIAPLTTDEDVDIAYAQMVSPEADWRDTIYRVITNQFSPNSYMLYLAFRRGVRDAMPLFEDDNNFSLSQIATAMECDLDFLRAEAESGSLRAESSGKRWHVTPEAFEAWYLANQSKTQQ